MGLFDKITRGITRGIGNAVQNAAERKATEVLTPKINEAADKLNRSQNEKTAEQSQQGASAAKLEAALGRFAGAAQGYATKAAQNIKVCPECGKPTDADKKFCPECGTALPETTLAQGAVCPECGKQNNLGEKFCAECGAKLPIAEQEERQARERDEQTMSEWDETLSQYPRWACGGSDFSLERYDEHVTFTPNFFGDNAAARQSVTAYRNVLKQNGFAPAGSYPSDEHLYKQIGETWYHVDTEHCFEGDPDLPSFGFDNQKPYVNEPKKKKGLFGIFG